jgi:hypothetical protein
VGLAVGLPLSKVVLSLSTIWIILVVLLHADFRTYGQNLRKNKAFYALIVFFAFHLLSLGWSADLGAALSDLKSKLPFYLVPLAFVVQPIETVKERYLLLGGFLAAMLFTSLYNFSSYVHWWGNHFYDDIRGMSLFISHIRYSLMITMAAALSLVWLLDRKMAFRWIAALLFLWFAFYTYYAQILSGVFTFIGVLFAVLVYYAMRSRYTWFKWGTLACIAGIVALMVLGLREFFREETCRISLTDLPYNTKEGNPYMHKYEVPYLENGYPIYYFISVKELRREWNKRSKIAYDSVDVKGQPIEATIIRYMTSRGLHKDAEGVHALTSSDIYNIEQGIPSILYKRGGFMQRLAGLKTELFQREDPNGHSVLQRFEFWKTGWKIFRKNWFAGVGPGDIDHAFQKQYVLDDSPLIQKNRLLSHNQYLSYMVSYGLIGFLLFMAVIFSFLYFFWKYADLTALLFMVIACLSFLVEDTLETQMGVTFFAFFYGLSLGSVNWLKQKRDPA